MDLPPDDWQRWQDEIQRCQLLSLEVTATVPPLRTEQLRRARYHADRRRVLNKVGPERAVAFLREEMLRALAGEQPDSTIERWFRLHRLEFGGPPIVHTIDMMDLGIRKLVAEGVADQVADRAGHRSGRPPCTGSVCNCV